MQVVGSNQAASTRSAIATLSANLLEAMKERMRSSFLKRFDPEQDIIGLTLLLTMFLAVNCISMTSVLHNSQTGHENFWSAVTGMLLLAGFIPLFLLLPFSFGFLVGASFYSTIAGICLDHLFHPFNLRPRAGTMVGDRVAASVSAAAAVPKCATAAFVHPIAASDESACGPASLLCRGRSGMELLLRRCVCRGTGSRAAAERICSPDSIELSNGIRGRRRAALCVCLPRRQCRYALAVVAILLIVSFYPALLNKTVLLAVIWLPLLFFLFRVRQTRIPQVRRESPTGFKCQI